MVRDAWLRIHPRGLADIYSCVSTYTRRRKATVENQTRFLVLARHASREGRFAIASIARSPLLTSFFPSPRLPPSSPFFSPEILHQFGNFCLPFPETRRRRSNLSLCHYLRNLLNGTYIFRLFGRIQRNCNCV